MSMSSKLQKKLYKSIDNEDLNKPENAKKYEWLVNRLRQNNMQSLTYDDAVFLVKYYAKEALVDLGVDERINIEIESRKIEKNIFGFKKKKELENGAMGVSKADEYKIIFSEDLIKNIMSGVPEKIFRSFRTVFHETKHIEQVLSKNQSLRRYIMALEIAARGVHPSMYISNYNTWYRENDAEEYGRKRASEKFDDIERYVDKSKFAAETTKFVKASGDDVKTVVGRYYNENNEILIPGVVYPEGKRIKILDLLAGMYIRRHPFKSSWECGILSLGFHLNGKPKTDVELLKEVEKILLSSENSIFEKNDIKQMYFTIMKNRYSNDYDKDIEDITEYTKSLTYESHIAKELIEEKKKMAESKIQKSDVKNVFYKYGIGIKKRDVRRRNKMIKKAIKDRNRRELSAGDGRQHHLDSTSYVPGIDQYKVTNIRYSVDTPGIHVKSEQNNGKVNNEERYTR